MKLISVATTLLFIVLTVAPLRAEPLTLLALGDSLTAGYGLDPSAAFPVKLEAALRDKGHNVAVINAGVSGDTAAQGAARLEWSLTDDVDAVIVELGANDALRGLAPAQAETALKQIVDALAARKLPVLLAGMRAPPNLGPDYVTAFEGMYQRLSVFPGVVFYPFFLDGVAADPKLNQADGLHPTPAGVDIIVARMLPSVEALLLRDQKIGLGGCTNRASLKRDKRRRKTMPRLFTGLEIPPDVALDLQIMQGGVPGARWMDPSQYHLTLRFIGDIDTGLAREIALGLDQLHARPFTLSLKGIGLFGGNKPRSIYAGVEDNGELKRLHDLHERLCQVLGLAAEPRRFVPHVTLARLKDPDPRALQRWIEVHSLYRSQPFEVERFVLFSSRPLKGGGPYGIEEAYGLGSLLMGVQ